MPAAKTATTPAKRPVGRPPAKSAAPKPAVKPVVKAEEPVRVMHTPAHLGPVHSIICPHCYPDGWPAGATGLACVHGVWTRRL